MRNLDWIFKRAIPEPNSGCWLWSGHLDPAGYGRCNVRGLAKLAHRASFLICGGVIPAGMALDHLCRVRCCVNPDHLEAVPQHVNIARGLMPAIYAARRDKPLCRNGHELSGANLYTHKGGRSCRICQSAAGRRRNAKKKELRT